MNQSSLEFALCKLMDLGGEKAAGSETGNAGDIRLEMLKFTRQKTPDIGGENIVLIFHIRREGEEPAGEGAGPGDEAGKRAGGGASTPADRTANQPADTPAAAPAHIPVDAPVRGKIPEA